jgi:hypothetical protein
MRDSERPGILPILGDRGPGTLLNDSACVRHHETVSDLCDDGKIVNCDAQDGDPVLRRSPIVGSIAIHREFH